ncbi:MAG: redoxin family protein [Bacteroidaceae bacterium]|jgi:thiol-disulfide isomerase/thioredoxin
MTNKPNPYCAILLLLLAGSGAAQAQMAYHISARIDNPDMEGKKMYLEVPDNKARIDSATVENGQIRMAGTAPWPHFVRIDSEDFQEFALFVLEDSVVIDFKAHRALPVGPLNRALQAYSAQKDSLWAGLNRKEQMLQEQYPDPKEHGQKLAEEWTQTIDQLFALYEDWIRSHPSDGVGEAVWRDGSVDAIMYNRGAETLQTLYSQLSPQLRSLQSAERGRKNIEGLKATAVGQPFVDIAGITAEKKPARLSDFAGKGKFTVVDFWASWCGPCRQEGRETLKPLWEKYKDGGNVTIVSVAVFDEFSRTLKALEEDGYTWPQIIDADKNTMEQYGIVAIPHILLIAPDGTILARGLRGGGIEQEILKHIDKH